jgi:hypothetical protein
MSVVPTFADIRTGTVHMGWAICRSCALPGFCGSQVEAVHSKDMGCSTVRSVRS